MKKYFIGQTILLLVGTLFAWFNVIKNFIRFYQLEGTIFKVTDCAIPNPVTEACFYGAFAFLVALIWSIVVLRRGLGQTAKLQHYLWLFLSAGTIFAWYNVAREFVAFYSVRSGPALGCSATPITNPFLTPCFTGASIFLLSAILSGVIYSKLVSRK
jgi:hypothetical protein